MNLDLSSGYQQIAMEESSICQTTSITHLREWDFLVMLCRLCDAPTTFQHLMDKAFVAKIDSFILVYLYDILVFTVQHRGVGDT